MTDKMIIEETINGLQSMIQSKKFIEHNFDGVVDEDICERAITLLKEQEERIKLLEQQLETLTKMGVTKRNSKPYNMNKNLEECPLDTLVILTDEYNNMYLRTITKERGRLSRGECIHGDAEQFYRNKIIGWEVYCPT